MLEHIETGALTLRGVDDEVLRALDSFLDNTDSDLAGLLDLHPNPVAGGQEEVATLMVRPTLKWLENSKSRVYHNK